MSIGVFKNQDQFEHSDDDILPPAYAADTTNERSRYNRSPLLRYSRSNYGRDEYKE